MCVCVCFVASFFSFLRRTIRLTRESRKSHFFAHLDVERQRIVEDFEGIRVRNCGEWRLREEKEVEE